MSMADRTDLLEALSTAAIAVFENHFETDTAEGTRMLALLKQLDGQVNECSNSLLELDLEVPFLKRRLEEATMPEPPKPPVVLSAAHEVAQAKFSAALERFTVEVEAATAEAQKATERLEAIEDPLARVAAATAELGRAGAKEAEAA